MNCRPIQNFFNPLAQSRCGLRLGFPYRLQSLLNVYQFNIGHGHFAQDWKSVCLECCLPLIAVLFVASFCLLNLNNSSGSIGEGHTRELSSAARLVGGFALNYRVNACIQFFTNSAGLIAGLRQCDARVTPQPHIAAHLERLTRCSEACLPGGITQHPRPRTSLGHLQIQARHFTSSIKPALCDPLHFQRG